MADISAVFGILLSLGIVFPGLLTAWRLLFPATVERAQLRLEHTPWRCFWLGGVLVAVLVVPIVVLLALPFGPAKLAGWVLIVAGLGFASLGAAGLAAKMAGQLARSSPGLSAPGAFVRAAVALELAAAFPVLGWFVAIPLITVTALGATVFALLHSVPAQARVQADVVAMAAPAAALRPQG
jgi:uncharacterized protein involved in cysteine biosynthesis